MVSRARLESWDPLIEVDVQEGCSASVLSGAHLPKKTDWPLPESRITQRSAINDFQSISQSMVLCYTYKKCGET